MYDLVEYNVEKLNQYPQAVIKFKRFLNFKNLSSTLKKIFNLKLKLKHLKGSNIQ